YRSRIQQIGIRIDTHDLSGAWPKQIAHAAAACGVLCRSDPIGCLVNASVRKGILTTAIEREAAFGAPQRAVGAETVYAYMPWRRRDQPCLDVDAGERLPARTQRAVLVNRLASLFPD